MAERRRAIFHRLIVLLDHLAPQGGAFGHALAWASGTQAAILGIPVSLRSQSALEGSDDDETRRRAAPGTGQLASAAIEPDQAALGRACARVCSQLHIDWDMFAGPEQRTAQIWQLVKPADLLVFGQALPAVHKKRLLREANRYGAPAVLVCPDACAPVARILVLDQGPYLRAGLLSMTAKLCRCFRATPVVLTVARSQRSARQQQQKAREALAQEDMDADYDFIVGSEVRSAVAHVARWRRCQLVVLQRPESRPWWRWLGASTAETLADFAQDLSFLALPHAGPLGMIGKPSGNARQPAEPLAQPKVLFPG